MNLFGLEITSSNGNRNGYVKKTDCVSLHNQANEHNKERYGSLEQRIKDLKDHVDTRFDDLKGLINRRHDR